MRRGTALAAALAFVASAASAQTPESAVKEFGLLGTWAADCTKPAAKDNIHSRYEAKDGQVLNLHDAGPDFVEEAYTVRGAKADGTDRLALSTVSRAGRQAEIVLRRIGDKMQVWRVTAADGFQPVNEGKYIVTDAPIPALSRCK